MPWNFVRVTIGGVNLDKLTHEATLNQVQVTCELNQHTWCRIDLRQTRDHRLDFEEWLGKDLLAVACEQGGKEVPLFDGLVLEAGLDYEVFGSYTAQITGVTRSYKLDLTRQQAYFRKQTLPEIAQKLASDDGLEAKVQCRTGDPKNYMQWGETDFEFLRRLADDYDCWMRPSPNGVEIFDRLQPGVALGWRREDGLVHFGLRGKLSPAAFSGTHYNPRKMLSRKFTDLAKPAEFLGSSERLVKAVEQESKSKLPSGFVYWDTRAATPAEFEEMLKKESARAIGSSVLGHGTSRNPEIMPGNGVKIEGLAAEADGEYLVTRVTHRWSPAGYENEFDCTPWAHYSAAIQPKPKPILGVAPARVVDHNDRRGMGRVRVKFPWQEEGETAWVRVVTPNAGPGRGFMFMPEIGDEVLVAFEQGDPERPYVLGSLWNGVSSAPRKGFWDDMGVQRVTVKNPGVIEIPDDVASNDVKRIVTKSGHQIEFVDVPGKECIVISTPGGQKIQMVDTCPDTKGRKMLCLTSPGDIFLHAPKGRVHIRSKFFSRETVGESVPQEEKRGGAEPEEKRKADEKQMGEKQVGEKQMGEKQTQMESGKK